MNEEMRRTLPLTTKDLATPLARTERLKPGPPASAVRVLITQEAEQAMTSEVMLYGMDDRETGGIVVGRWLDTQTVLIVAATGAGPQASRQRLSFSLDAAYVNQRLARLRQMYAAVDYIGEWHKHPATLPRPSAGDLNTARGLLAEPGYPDHLLNPIIVWTGEQALINYYYIDANLPDFTRVIPQKVSLQRCKALLEERPVAHTAAWWYGVAGRQRLETEVAQLQAHGYSVSRSERTAAETWEIEAASYALPPRRFVFRCAGVYPSDSPTVLAFANGTPDARMCSATLSAWQPDNYLYEIAEDVQRNARERVIKQAGGAALAVALIVALLLALSALTQPTAQPPTPGEEGGTATMTVQQDRPIPDNSSALVINRPASGRPVNTIPGGESADTPVRDHPARPYFSEVQKIAPKKGRIAGFGNSLCIRA